MKEPLTVTATVTIPSYSLAPRPSGQEEASNQTEEKSITDDQHQEKKSAKKFRGKEAPLFCKLRKPAAVLLAKVGRWSSLILGRRRALIALTDCSVIIP